MTETAANAYAGKRETTDLLLTRLAYLVEEHSGKALSDPKNWGLVGDLERVNELLVEAERALGGSGE